MGELAGQRKPFNSFTGNQLKVFEIILMAMEHRAWTLWPGYENKSWWLIAVHTFGRLAAPTMWFMVSKGYQHTKASKNICRALNSDWNYPDTFIWEYHYNCRVTEAPEKQKCRLTFASGSAILDSAS